MLTVHASHNTCSHNIINNNHDAHDIVGIPREPQFGDNIASGPGTGEVTLEIKTVASGVNNPDQEFRFIITPELDGDTLNPIRFDFPSYESGTLESITVRGLEPERSYSFIATAMNNFGKSSPANSHSVRAGIWRMCGNVLECNVHKAHFNAYI